MVGPGVPSVKRRDTLATAGARRYDRRMSEGSNDVAGATAPGGAVPASVARVEAEVESTGGARIHVRRFRLAQADQKASCAETTCFSLC